MNSLLEALKSINIEDFDPSYILPLEHIELKSYSLLYVSQGIPAEDMGLKHVLIAYLNAFQESDPVSLLVYSKHTEEITLLLEAVLKTFENPADLILLGGEIGDYNLLSFRRSLQYCCTAVIVSETQADYIPQLTTALALERQIFFLGSKEHIPAIFLKSIDQSENLEDLSQAMSQAADLAVRGQQSGSAFNKDEILRLQGRVMPSKRIPCESLIFAAMPKSASTFTARTLRHSLNVPLVELTPGASIPLDYNILIPDLLDYFKQLPRVIAYDHFKPSPYNLFLMQEYGLDRVMVTVRDPRQALLSTLKAREVRRNKNAKISSFQFPKNFDNWSIQEQIDLSIDVVLPELIGFLNSWLQLSQSPNNKIEILFNHFYDAKNDPEYYFSRILQFWGIPREQFNYRAEYNRPKREESIFAANPKVNSPHIHFRKGDLDEWREVFSSEQIARATAKIPDELISFFKWNRP